MKVKKNRLSRILTESLDKALSVNKKISKEELAQRIYESVVDSINELKHETVLNAVNKLRSNRNALLFNGVDITEDTMRSFLKDKNPAQKRRYIKLWKSGKLLDRMVRQEHLFATVTNTGLEWLRDNTDIPISPEFFEGNEKSWGKGYRNTDRKPTKDEHDFYRYFSSGMQDTEGMSEETVMRYSNAVERLFNFLLGNN